MFSSLLRHITSSALKKGGSFHKLHSLSSQCSQVKVYSIPTSSNGLILKLNSTTDYTPNFKPVKPLILDNPSIKNTFIKEIPFIPNLSYTENTIFNKIIEEEPTQIIEKQAARLIVIRRRKMKRHKLKKLRRKMKFEWAKVRQRRELKKEKLFQAELMGKIKETERFDPALYAAEKIKKANEVLLPKLWRGKRLPEFIIKELIIESANKKAKRLERIERRKKISLKVSDYKV
ncbi:hypothetical protein O3M35_009586 [Rhynocoris fuscipes]|uniref:Ribosomal protein mS38 C-terminal domain-containing protein n=1 Tax=Rhynocoris fuscipes TaxID=488301 RepID=A0AAW1D3H6_9HEMI